MESRPRPLVLPPGVDVATYTAFIGRAAEICGADNVTVISSTDELTKEHYDDPSKVHDMFHVFDKDYFIASATISPRKVAEVPATMRLCNEFKVPVWPFSIGRNVGYGGAASRVPGSIGLDMGQHMNRVLEVNVSGAYCL